MSKSPFRTQLEGAVSARHSRLNPFTEQWGKGELTRAQLGAWAAQHHQYVSQFPRWCATVYGQCPDPDARDFLLENIIEEESGTKHVDLLIRTRRLSAALGQPLIDEADRMFDMGFIADLRFILRRLPKPEKRQSFLFSATLSFRVLELTWEFMNNPAQISITPRQKTVEKAEQVLYHVGREEKFSLLLGLLKREGGSRILIFANTREEARRLEDRRASRTAAVEPGTEKIARPPQVPATARESIAAGPISA